MIQVETPEEEDQNTAQLRGEFWTRVCEAIKSETKFEFANSTTKNKKMWGVK